MSRSCELTHLAVPLEEAEGTPSAPSADTDGGDITDWRDGKHCPRLVKLTLFSAASADLSDAWLDGWDGTRWYQLAKLQDGETISLSNTLGWSETFADVGTFERLAVHGTLSASTLTATATPVEEL
jgi:hypothetical protein